MSDKEKDAIEVNPAVAAMLKFQEETQKAPGMCGGDTMSEEGVTEIIMEMRYGCPSTLPVRDEMSEAEFAVTMEQGYTQAVESEGTKADAAFDDLRKKIRRS